MNGIFITGSVGRGGTNNYGDVITVQRLLNKNIQKISPVPLLREDGIIGQNTITAIETFQRRVAGVNPPDGRVDPGGKTFAKLTESDKRTVNSQTSMRFPFRARPALSYKTDIRRFGSNRDHGKRLHAGCDLYASVGTEILAVKDGTVSLDAYPFYLGTKALEVDHGDFVVRYGEILNAATGINKKVQVTRGQVIAYVGKLQGLANSMLHFEMYSGKGVGPLTNKSNKPYQRRSDLLDPTPYLDMASLS